MRSLSRSRPEVTTLPAPDPTVAPSRRRPPAAERRMSLRDHLRELRRRVLLSLVGLAIGAVVGWVVYSPVFDALQRPLVRLASERGGLIAVNFAGIATSFDMRIKISLFLGVLLSSPWWVYQLWSFVTPGMTSANAGTPSASSPPARHSSWSERSSRGSCCRTPSRY